MALLNAVMDLEMAHVYENVADVADFDVGPRFHPREDPFDLSERQFINNFRLKKEQVRTIINLVENHSREPTRSSALNAEVQVLATLRFFASGSYQNCVGKNFYVALSQPSISRSIHNVTNVLNMPEVMNQWIHFPSNMEELQQMRNKFWTTQRFPATVGCVDCTHVAIFPPKTGDENFPEHIYVNRKGYHSINVQLICDPDLRITSINARYPGSTNDAYIWNNSNILPIMRDITHNGHTFFLLGDSGYALRQWMMTPIIGQELNDAMERYNIAQKRTRSIIERCNGLLKMRFRCILKHRVLHYHPQMCSKIVNACAVLHNMCIADNVPMPDEDEVDFEEEMEFNDVFRENEGHRNLELTAGRRLRNNIIHEYFT